MKYVNKPYAKRGKFYLGSSKKQRGSFLPLVGLAAKLLPIASTVLSILGKDKKKRGRKRRRLR